jgi:bifunctional non-homologous end joining protein LigD
MKKLKNYRDKREFEKTNEPNGEQVYKNKKAEGKEKISLFVVQHHIASRDHYDFRLEWKGVLLSWAIPKGPSFNSKDKRLAIQVEDHPLDYSNFEGIIPKGQYGGGTVMIWDEGDWEPLEDFSKGLKKGILKFSLNGKRLKGNWSLIKIKDQELEKQNSWILIKEKDKYASEIEIEDFKTSVKTGRTMEEIAENKEKKIKKNPFDKVDVQLAKITNEIPKGDDWLFETKYDGYRIVAFIENNEAKLITRNGKDFTDHFKSVQKSLIEFSKGRAMVLDGEMCIINEKGITDFQLLQDSKNKIPPTYIVFDLLSLDGKDLRKLSLVKRKEELKKLMTKAPQNLHYSEHVIGRGEEAFEAVCRLKMEGIVGKRADSNYCGNRNGDWIKIKCDNRQEFVVGGYTKTQKRDRGISSLLLGLYKKRNLFSLERQVQE